MIRFNCPACGHSIRTPAAQGGRRGLCPNCHGPVTVPEAEPASRLGASLHLKPEAVEPPPPEPVFTDPPRPRPPARAPGQRNYPPLLDIWFYPLSVAGILAVVVTWLLWGLLSLGAVVPVCMIRLAALAGVVVVGAYFVTYWTDCIRDSAGGGTRAPETVGRVPELWDAVGQWLSVLGVGVFLTLPGIGLYLWQGPSPAFWVYAGAALFISPMAILAAVIIDDPFPIHPLLWIAAAAKTLLPYLGLTVLIHGLNALIPLLTQRSAWAPILSIPLGLYLSLITAHLLGRFYFRYEERLGW